MRPKFLEEISIATNDLSATMRHFKNNTQFCVKKVISEAWHSTPHNEFHSNLARFSALSILDKFFMDQIRFFFIASKLNKNCLFQGFFHGSLKTQTIFFRKTRGFVGSFQICPKNL